MRFRLTVPNFGDYFDPCVLAALARDAEHAGRDGVVPVARGSDMTNFLSPDEVRDVVAYISERRSGDETFDIVVSGHSSADDATQAVQDYDDAGARWWLEDVSPWAFGWQWDGSWPIDQMNDRVRAGPPLLRSDD